MTKDATETRAENWLDRQLRLAAAKVRSWPKAKREILKAQMEPETK